MGWARRLAIFVAAVAAFLAAVLGIASSAIDLWAFIRGTPRYEGRFALTYVGNRAFVDFLRKHDGEVVEIDARVDVGASFLGHELVREKCGRYTDYYQGRLGKITNRIIPLPLAFEQTDYLADAGNLNCTEYSIEIVSDRDEYPVSYGGVGLAEIRIKETFRVLRVARSTQSILFVLEER